MFPSRKLANLKITSQPHSIEKQSNRTVKLFLLLAGSASRRPDCLTQFSNYSVSPCSVLCTGDAALNWTQLAPAPGLVCPETLSWSDAGWLPAVTCVSTSCSCHIFRVPLRASRDMHSLGMKHPYRQRQSPTQSLILTTHLLHICWIGVDRCTFS